MPTYEYACPKCGIVEHFQSIKAEALTICPQCQKAKVTRMFSGGGAVLFKGDGFWETDYRSEAYRSQAKKEQAPQAAAAPAKAATPPPSSPSSPSST